MSKFDDYFLKGQQEGCEIYLGRDIVLVVYEQEKTIGIQGIGKDAVFWNFTKLDDTLEKMLTRLRTEENRKGIQPGLTKEISMMWQYLHSSHENNSEYYMQLSEAY